jgi:hypothetical protein
MKSGAMNEKVECDAGRKDPESEKETLQNILPPRPSRPVAQVV